jgi:hypothetical protein
VNITRALNDPNVFAPHFKGDSWACWFVFLAALFGLPLSPDQLLLFKQFTGRDTAPTSPLREAWLVVGRRGGKSFVLAVTAVFLACFKDWKPYLGPGEVGTIMIIAKDRAQARAIKRFISGLLRETPMLAPLIEDETAESIRLTNRVAIEIHTASYRSTRGYTIIAALLDEIAIWESDEFAAEPDVEVINAIKPGMLTVPGSVLLCASSPHARRGALWEAYRKHYGQDGDPILVWQAPTRAMNATVPQADIDAHMAEDPARASAEYLAQFRTDVETFISREVIDAAVVPGRHDLPRMDGVTYTGFTDPSGGSSDSMTLSICHVEGDAFGVKRSVTDLIRETKPPFSPDAVVAEFAALLKAYGIHTVWGDRYAGVWPRERFAVHGINYQIPGKSASDLYTELLPILNSRRAELPDNPRLVSQLCQLERHAGNTKDNVKHPPGGHDDVANAVAGAMVMALQVAATEVTSFPMPFVAGTPRNVPGADPVVVGEVVCPPGPNPWPSAPAAAAPAAPRAAPAWQSWVDAELAGSHYHDPWANRNGT